jgi:hypothetical protein
MLARSLQRCLPLLLLVPLHFRLKRQQRQGRAGWGPGTAVEQSYTQYTSCCSIGQHVDAYF